jgi:hypothetical protein
MGDKSFATFKSELLWALGNRASADVNTMEGKWINSAYRSLTSRNKFWKFKVPKTFTFEELDTSTTATGNDGDAYISKPSDGIFVHTVWDMTSDNMLGYKDHIWYTGQTGRADADSEGEPTNWTPYGNKLYLWPTLDDEYNFTIYYRKRIADMTDTETTVIGAEWDEPILMLAIIRGNMFLGDFETAKQWRDEFILTIQDLMGMQDRQRRYARDRFQPSSQHTQRRGY